MIFRKKLNLNDLKTRFPLQSLQLSLLCEDLLLDSWRLVIMWSSNGVFFFFLFSFMRIWTSNLLVEMIISWSTWHDIFARVALINILFYGSYVGIYLESKWRASTGNLSSRTNEVVKLLPSDLLLQFCFIWPNKPSGKMP